MTKLPITGQLAISGNYLINRYFDDARRQIATLLEAVDLDISKPIKWSDLPPEKRRAVAQIYQQVLAQMTAVVGSATSRAWIAQTEQSKALSILDKEERRQLTEENLRKLSAFRSRKVGGLSLSGRIWQYVKQEQDSIELVLQRVIAEQNNSGDAYKLFAKYLDAPEEMIRYIQKQGKPDETAKAFAQFHRGTGVYRDPVKNILRMMRTEVNRATKTADWQLMQSNPYVVGYEIKRSSREHKYKDKCEVCKRLVGVYPKTFHFVGWHPQCECACTPIYASREEQRQIRRQLKAGKKPEEIRSQEGPRGLPTAFVSVMAQYQTEGRALPFAMSEALSTYKPSPLDSSRLRQAKRTPEERKAIQERWDGRYKAYRKQLQREAKEKFSGQFVPLSIGDVKITSNSIKEWLNQPHSMYREKNELIRQIDQVILGAEYIGKSIYHKEGKSNIVFSHIMKTKVVGIDSWIILREDDKGVISLHSISDNSKVTNGLIKN